MSISNRKNKNLIRRKNTSNRKSSKSPVKSVVIPRKSMKVINTSAMERMSSYVG